MDLVIRGGTVVDGTGAAPRTADVAIADGMIREIGSVSAKGVEEIDAQGALVTPASSISTPTWMRSLAGTGPSRPSAGTASPRPSSETAASPLRPASRGIGKRWPP
jgi:hypothetical protein